MRDLVQRASSRAIKDSGSADALSSPQDLPNSGIVPSSESSHETARKLRRQQTPAEQILWRHLRGRRICDVKFRRQYPIGPYFADFCSIERKLIVEIDGAQHADRSADDETRTTYLASRGYRVLRFWNNQVLGSVDEVLAEIEKLLNSDSSES